MKQNLIGILFEYHISIHQNQINLDETPNSTKENPTWKYKINIPRIRSSTVNRTNTHTNMRSHTTVIGIVLNEWFYATCTHNAYTQPHNITLSITHHLVFSDRSNAKTIFDVWFCAKTTHKKKTTVNQSVSQPYTRTTFKRQSCVCLPYRRTRKITGSNNKNITNQKVQLNASITHWNSKTDGAAI